MGASFIEKTSAYMLDGRLYVRHRTGGNDAGEEITLKFLSTAPDISESGHVTDEGYKEYFALLKNNRVLFKDGEYQVGVNGVFYPVVSLESRRVSNPGKMPFYDDVFVVLHNGEAFNDIRFTVPSSETPLKQGDKLVLKVGGSQYIRYWDQISKLWYQEKTSKDHIDMAEVKGGTFLMGDPDGEAIFCNYPAYPINIKKLWRTMYDPQFMNETARGEAALGVEGLDIKNSTAVNPKSPFWLLNDDALPQFPVRLDDYMIGRFQVTMDQYYRFVDELAVSGDQLFYEINERHYVNEIAAVALKSKKTRVVDSDWGMGQRPAIDIHWFEALEYCNWLSRKKDLPVCYSFVPVYDGKEGIGKTAVSCLLNVSGSSMRKEDGTLQLQLYDVRCDFTKDGYRLPTEAEFEYAAKGGEDIPKIRDGKGYAISGTTAEDAADKELINYYACWTGNTQNPSKAAGQLLPDNMGGNGYTSPVGSKLPNNLGIYDMSGNVWETVWDHYSLGYYEKMSKIENIENPTGTSYTVLQLSVFSEDCDETTKNEYGYSYETKDGLKKRVSCASLSNKGRFAHTLRGGSWANPYLLIKTSNRFVGARSYVNNSPLFSDARIGFRLARTNPCSFDVFSKIKEMILLHYHEYAADFDPAGEKNEKQKLFALSQESQSLAMSLYEDGNDFFYTSIQAPQIIELKDKASWKDFMSEPKPHREHKVHVDTLTVQQIETGRYRAAYVMDVSIEERGELRFKVTMNFRRNEAGELKILNCLQEGGICCE